MIVAVFKDNDDYTKAYGLWQWDYGQELRIQGLDLPTAVEIHFALQETGGEAVTRVGITKDGITTVPIPDSMLEGEGAAYDYQIYAWVYLSDTKSGETIKRITMPVKARSKPEPFETPEDVEIFREAIEAVNEAADRAEKAGAEAVKVGEEAKEAAAKAGEHLEAVQSLAGQVEINADAVAQDKQAVAGMVTQTQQAASEAALSAQAAKQSQTAAEQAQAGAEAAEDTARQYAAETEEDRLAVTEAKREVTQMRQEVAVDRQAVEDAVAGFDGAVNQAVGEIAAAGKTQVGAVNTAGQTAVQAVNTTKGEAVEAVEAEGTEQAGIVAAEGAKQLGEIARVMATIPEDYTQLDQHVQDLDNALNTKAPAIRLEATVQNGGPTKLPTPGDSGLQSLVVYGKSTQRTTTGAQLFDARDLAPANAILSSSTDGSVITLEGSKEYCNANLLLPENVVNLAKGKTMYIHGVISGGTKTSTIQLNIHNEDGTIDRIGYYSDKKDSSIAVTDRVKKIDVRLLVNNGEATETPVTATFTDVMVSLSPITEWEPYTGGIPAPNPNYPQEIESVGEEVGIGVTGAQLFDSNNMIAYNATVSYSNDGQIITVKGSKPYANAEYAFPRSIVNLAKGRKLYINGSISTEDAVNANIQTVLTDKNSKQTYFNTKTVNILENTTGISIRLLANNAEELQNQVTVTFTDVMVSLLPISKWEPYREPSTAILPTPNGLPGIPVTSGGNYIDPDGQQWVCDTIEWDRVSRQKEYVQRVGKKSVFDCVEVGFVNGDENVVANRAIFAVEKNNSLGNFYPVYCDKFKYSEINDFNKAEPYLCTLRTATNADWSYTSRLYLFVPKTITSFDELRELLNGECNFIHALATPIRHQLTADQIKALESLHTFSPTSIISNDAGADMQVIYAADTKAYIDSKIDALSKTILDAIAGGK